MLQKPNTFIACLNSDNLEYIKRFNEYLFKNYEKDIFGATENKKIYTANK
jgi:hypothetical protein